MIGRQINANNVTRLELNDHWGIVRLNEYEIFYCVSVFPSQKTRGFILIGKNEFLWVAYYTASAIHSFGRLLLFPKNIFFMYKSKKKNTIINNIISSVGWYYFYRNPVKRFLFWIGYLRVLSKLSSFFIPSYNILGLLYIEGIPLEYFCKNKWKKTTNYHFWFP